MEMIKFLIGLGCIPSNDTWFYCSWSLDSFKWLIDNMYVTNEDTIYRCRSYGSEDVQEWIGANEDKIKEITELTELTELIDLIDLSKQ